MELKTINIRGKSYVTVNANDNTGNIVKSLEDVKEGVIASKIAAEAAEHSRHCYILEK